MKDERILELIKGADQMAVRHEAGLIANMWEDYANALRHLHDEVKALRARQAELEGRKPDGYAAQCEDGSLCYEYFTEHREGIEHALKVDGWEGMEPVPVCIMRSSKEDK